MSSLREGELRRRCHCIPRRHFIFSVLGGHVINRSQYESTIPLTVRHFVYNIHPINVLVRLLSRSFYNLDTFYGDT